MRALGAAAALVATLCGTAAAAKHSYVDGDNVKLWANVVGPFSNPSVTYQYYERLPFCQPPDGRLVHKPATLGELVDGNRLVLTPYDIAFMRNRERAALCTKALTRAEVQRFQAAIRDDFYFQMVLDETLPVWGFVGKLEKVEAASPAEKELHRISLFAHIHFDIAYNQDRVIEVNVSTDASRTVDISEDATPNTEDGTIRADFTYTVVWTPTDTPFARRMEKYRRVQFLPQHLEVHWFSIVNSMITVLLLTGFLATILLRVVRQDFLRFSRDEDAMEDAEESGWKYCHGDVFRFPSNCNLFCALVGTGTQLLWLGVFIFLLSCVGAFAPHSRGSMYTALIILYALTAGIAGYTAGSYYRQMGGTAWVRNTLLTCIVFCGPFFIAFCVNNTIAWAQGSTAAFPFGTICIIAIIWALVTIPLTILGAIIGKNARSEFRAPCRTTKYPREVPDLPWYRSALPQMLVAGLLPFSAIYIELFYIFASVWGHRIYTIWPILFVVFIILLIVTAFICVAMTYFQLAAEDHRWWWRSFFCGGSTGLFVYAYSIYFYFQRSDMSGLMQSCFFFGYVACVCLGFFIMLGTVGWQASLLFVRHIYKAIKCE